MVSLSLGGCDCLILDVYRAIIIASLFPNTRLVHYKIFSYDFPKIRNLPKIFLRSFENVGPLPTFVLPCCQGDSAEGMRCCATGRFVR